MTDKILVAVDDSPQSDAALDYALDTFPDADVTALHVVALPEGYWAAFADTEEDMPGYERTQRRSRELLEEARRRADERGVEIETETRTGRPAPEIVEHAEEGEFDQVVVGSHGRHGAARVLLGSVSEGVVRRSPTPVIVVR